MHLFFLLGFVHVRVPLAGRISGGLENTRGAACIFNRRCPIYYTLFYFLASHLVLHYIRITFFVNIFLLLGCVPLARRILHAVSSLENTTS